MLTKARARPSLAIKLRQECETSRRKLPHFRPKIWSLKKPQKLTKTTTYFEPGFDTGLKIPQLVFLILKATYGDNGLDTKLSPFFGGGAEYGIFCLGG